MSLASELRKLSDYYDTLNSNALHKMINEDGLYTALSMTLRSLASHGQRSAVIEFIPTTNGGPYIKSINVYINDKDIGAGHLGSIKLNITKSVYTKTLQAFYDYLNRDLGLAANQKKDDYGYLGKFVISW